MESEKNTIVGWENSSISASSGISVNGPGIRINLNFDWLIKELEKKLGDHIHVDYLEALMEIEKEFNEK